MYDAVGTKLRKKVTDGTSVVTQDYLGGIEFKNNRLEAIYNEEGRAYNIAPLGLGTYTWRYEYNLKDHLGNTRVVFCDKNKNGIIENASEILQETHYYPFGMAFGGAWYNDAAASKYKYLYNGKELNEEFGLNLSDYGARWYDAAVGRWWNVDPLADMYSKISNYAYVANNPIRLIDPDGQKIFDKNNVQAEITYKEGGISITNVSKLDMGLVQTLINTALESKTGLGTIKDLDKAKDSYQIVQHDKPGVFHDEETGQSGQISGITITNDPKKIMDIHLLFIFLTIQK